MVDSRNRSLLYVLSKSKCVKPQCLPFQHSPLSRNPTPQSERSFILSYSITHLTKPIILHPQIWPQPYGDLPTQKTAHPLLLRPSSTTTPLHKASFYHVSTVSLSPIPLSRNTKRNQIKTYSRFALLNAWKEQLKVHEIDAELLRRRQRPCGQFPTTTDRSLPLRPAAAASLPIMPFKEPFSAEASATEISHTSNARDRGPKSRDRGRGGSKGQFRSRGSGRSAVGGRARSHGTRYGTNTPGRPFG